MCPALNFLPVSVRPAGKHGEIRPRRTATRIFNNRITKGEEKKEWLQRYKIARQLFSFRLQQLETAKTDAGHTTQNISPVPGGAGDGQALPRAVERIQEAEERAAAQACICDEICEEVTAALDTLDDLCDRDVLYRKYIRCQSWNEIMQGTSLSKSAVLAHHRQAIKSLKLESQD